MHIGLQAKPLLSMTNSTENLENLMIFRKMLEDYILWKSI